MTYSQLHPDAQPFEEVQSLLFCMLDHSKCLWCKDWTPWITYRFDERPIAVCGVNCMRELMELNAALNGQFDDYQPR